MPLSYKAQGNNHDYSMHVEARRWSPHRCNHILLTYAFTFGAGSGDPR